jgi:peptidoglycan/LPS O-acetylase OafA/YrhL
VNLPQLTFTRFIAATGIVLWHYGRPVPPFTLPIIRDLVEKGSACVSFFFVLSGFILVVAQSSEGRQPQSINPNVFWIHRVARIYPLYMFALVFHLFLIVSDSTPNERIEPAKTLLHIALLQAWFPSIAMAYNSPGWSLSAEAFFYLLFPLLYLIFQKLRTSTCLIAGISVWVANIVACIALQNQSVDPTFLWCSPVLHLGSFALGAATGTAFVRHHARFIAAKRLMALVLILSAVISVFSVSYHWKLSALFHNGIYAPVFLLGIVWLSVDNGKVSKLFAHPRLQHLGEISYGIYILQVPIWIAFSALMRRTLDLGWTPRFYLYCLLLGVVTTLLHRYFERPARRWIRSWDDR